RLIVKKKSLGQHFLIEDNIARKIVRISDIGQNDIVWEIGPGSGVLTRFLLEKCRKLFAFEIDNEWFGYLQSLFEQTNHTLINADILQVDFNKYFDDEKVKIVANLPYQITSPLLFKILENRDLFSSITVMIQDEVADRICARSGNKEYGKLSIKLQLYYTIKKKFSVPPHVFRPQPKVNSAVVQLIPKQDVPEILNHKQLWDLIDKVFNHRRKMLRVSLKPFLAKNEYEQLLDTSALDFTRRPEDLSIREFVDLSNAIETIKEGA
ncbi:MAG TPA: ribosomal RNA small subunit methyltransferase A, partial [Candidatus Cloacimonetes bacterium]|nr:ribosomal RNA small subunit methyltransferase A [Candidatus Cloacimonadota bacterium]